MAVYSAITLPPPSRIVMEEGNEVPAGLYEFMSFRADLRDYWVGRDAVFNASDEIIKGTQYARYKDKSFSIISLSCEINNSVYDQIKLTLKGKD
jgi:hypothetical protein